MGTRGRVIGRVAGASRGPQIGVYVCVYDIVTYYNELACIARLCSVSIWMHGTTCAQGTGMGMSAHNSRQKRVKIKLQRYFYRFYK